MPVPKTDASILLESIKPAEPSSSTVGKSLSFCKLKWLKNSSVVPYCIGLPGTFYLPCGLTQLSSISISSVLVPNATPLISSISALVTGWW